MLVREVNVRSALTRSRLFEYCVNPYAGCANACVYCYARFATRFSHPGEEWGSYVDVRINAPSVLARDLSRAHPGTVYLSSVCDAWQAPEAEYGVTRQCLQLILDAGFPLFLQTKNALVERDFDLVKRQSNLRLGVTVTTVDERAARTFEPGASTANERLRVLAAARLGATPERHQYERLMPFESARCHVNGRASIIDRRACRLHAEEAGTPPAGYATSPSEAPLDTVAQINGDGGLAHPPPQSRFVG